MPFTDTYTNEHKQSQHSATPKEDSDIVGVSELELQLAQQRRHCCSSAAAYFIYNVARGQGICSLFVSLSVCSAASAWGSVWRK
jgi:hypothetical protein